EPAEHGEADRDRDDRDRHGRVEHHLGGGACGIRETVAERSGRGGAAGGARSARAAVAPSVAPGPAITGPPPGTVPVVALPASVGAMRFTTQMPASPRPTAAGTAVRARTGH